MKCPLSYRLTTDAKSVLMIEAMDCLKEECAWWDKSVNACSVTSLTRNVNALTAEVIKLRDTMSQDERTRRR